MSKEGVGAGSAFFGNAGDFGVAMAVIWPLAGSLIFGETKKLYRLLLLCAVTTYLGALLLCGSRGALVAATITACVALGRHPKKLAGVVMLFLVLGGAVYILPHANKERLRSAVNWEADQTASLRVTLWKAGLRMFFNHPLLGVGPRNFGLSYASQYAPDDAEAHKWAPHSIYIQALAELGVPGALGLLGMGVFFLRMNSQTRRHLQSLGLAEVRSFDYRMTVALDLALVGFLVSGAFLTVLYYPHFWILLGLTAGLHRACLRKNLASSAGNMVSDAGSASG
jgi:O-antigen ligase